MAKANWSAAFKPLLEKYKGKKHPLEYHNVYQLVVMVVLSAQDSDRNINRLAPDLFKAFPDMKTLAAASEKEIFPFVSKVRNFGNKTKWLMAIAQTIKNDKNIPSTLEELTKLPGIGRKSANVIMREMGVKAVGVIVDLHVVRVAPRIGIAYGTDPKKIEQQLMDALPPENWGEAGMALSFLGRETCRPTYPEHHNCAIAPHCAHFKSTNTFVGGTNNTIKKATPKKTAIKVPVKKTVTTKTIAKKPATKKK